MDPNSVIGEPIEREYWLSPDWSQKKLWREGSSAPGSGWTRVSVREVLYADGRRLSYVLGSDETGRQPIAADGTPAPSLAEARPIPGPPDIDKDQEKRFKEAQEAASRTAPTRNINGVPHQVTGKDANGQDIWSPVVTATGPATATTSTAIPADAVPRIEGTPLPGGGFDNEAPVQVWRRPDGTVVKTEPLTGPERTKWEEDRQRSRNPGRKTDAEIEKDAAIARTTRASELSALKPGTTISTIAGKKYTTIVTPSTTPGGQPTITHLGPDNQPTAALPPEPPESTSTAITRNGQTFIQTTTKTPEGQSSVTFTDTAGKPVTELPREGATALPEGMPELDTTTPEAARSSYLAQVRWAQEQQRAGKMTRQEVVDLLTPSHQAAETVVSAAQQQIENARAERETANRERGTSVTEQGQRFSAATNQFQNAQSAVNDVWKVAPRGGTQSGDVLLGTLLLQQLLSRSPTGQAGAVPAGAAPAPGVAPTTAATAPLPAPTGVAAVDAIAANAAPNMAPAPQPIQNPDGSFSSPMGGVYAPKPNPPGAGLTTFQNGAPAVAAPVAPTLPNAVTVRHKVTGLESQVTPDQLQQMTNRDEFDVVDETPVSQMPSAVQQIQGRALVDSIMSRYGSAA